jgi:hypothetical protein
MSELKNEMGELTLDDLSLVSGGAGLSDAITFLKNKAAKEDPKPSLPCDSFDILCRLGF